jgi:hypothetical protein
MPLRRATLALTLALAATPALAQNGPFNVLGTVERVGTDTVTVKTDDGAEQSFTLAPNVLVVQAKPATLADIKPGDYVASAAVRKADGKLHSTELRIFPDVMRGVGEGQRPMNDAQNQTMTNAAVTGAAVRNGSNDIEVTFANGAKSELILDPGVPVTRLDPADPGLVAPGAKVRVQGTRTGSDATATRITVQ